MRYLLWMAVCLLACEKEPVPAGPTAYRISKTITYNDVAVDVIIDKPAREEVDVLLVFHGTVQFDSNLPAAGTMALDKFKGILDRSDMMIVSVLYPQEHVIFGDNIIQGEAALLWVKHRASQELGVRIGKVFMAGHSQGGYMVTRLNTLHPSDGVIANAPGPLNLVYRCQLEESGQIPAGAVCNRLRSVYGSTGSNPEAYVERSLLNYTKGFQADILFVQGLQDSPIQMYSWPIFKEAVANCSDCRGYQWVEIPGGGHDALFESPEARAAFNAFLGRR